jgi:hypothetical protein
MRIKKITRWIAPVLVAAAVVTVAVDAHTPADRTVQTSSSGTSDVGTSDVGWQ